MILNACAELPRTSALKDDLPDFPVGGRRADPEAPRPLYDELAKATSQRPEWNFHKYLIGRNGQTVASFKSGVEPDSPEFVARVEEYLRQP
jgi:glutathione peroxidase-family protein